MNRYICFFKGVRFEINAETSYQAQQKAIEQLLIVELVEKDSTQITSEITC